MDANAPTSIDLTFMFFSLGPSLRPLVRPVYLANPFEWSAEEQAVVYVGPDAEASRKRHLYFY
jgi:hypothetical protein